MRAFIRVVQSSSDPTYTPLQNSPKCQMCSYWKIGPRCPLVTILSFFRCVRSDRLKRHWLWLMTHKCPVEILTRWNIWPSLYKDVRCGGDVCVFVVLRGLEIDDVIAPHPNLTHTGRSSARIRSGSPRRAEPPIHHHVPQAPQHVLYCGVVDTERKIYILPNLKCSAGVHFPQSITVNLRKYRKCFDKLYSFFFEIECLG